MIYIILGALVIALIAEEIRHCRARKANKDSFDYQVAHSYAVGSRETEEKLREAHAKEIADLKAADRQSNESIRRNGYDEGYAKGYADGNARKAQTRDSKGHFVKVDCDG